MSGHNIANVEVDFYMLHSVIYFQSTYICCVHLLICVSHFKFIIIEGRFFVFEVVSGQKSVISGYSAMSVPPPKRGKFIFDHTELFVYKFYINRKEIFFGIRQQ